MGRIGARDIAASKSKGETPNYFATTPLTNLPQVWPWQRPMLVLI